MIYTHENCAPNCWIIDDDTCEKLEQVESVDTDSRQIVQFEIPLRVLPDGETLATITRTFERAEITLDRADRMNACTLHGLRP